jgi:nucleoside phosphorylase
MTDHDPGLHRIKTDPKYASSRSSDSPIAAVAVPWPAAHHPKPVRPTHAPADSAPLTPHDVLIVTWTAGEAHTLASLFGSNLDDWYEYRHNVTSFIPKVTGTRAPFNDDSAEMKRYHHSLGIYASFTIGKISVLALKSGLHMAYDGPDVPMVDLWKQLVAEVKPKIVITTGTGGGIGASIGLGDVVIGKHVRFNLTGELKGKPYAKTMYPCSAFSTELETKMKGLIATAMLSPNGDKLDPPRVPKMIFSSTGIVSTDTFAFDDSTDHFGLQGLGQCCDMGDATLGLAMSQIGAGAPQWIAIRNASDPQIPNPTKNIDEAKKTAEQIYSRSQCLTTAGSVIASWAAAIAVCGG